MKITFLVPSFHLGGGPRVEAHLAHELCGREHDVLVVGRPNARPIPPLDRFKGLVRGGGWQSTKIDSRGPYFEDLRVPHRILDRWRPIVDADVPDADVVVATWWETAEWAAALSPRKGAKAYFIQQYEANFGQPEERVAATWKLPFQKIVCSRWLADMARDRFNNPTAVVVPNGIDLTLFHASPRGKQDRPTAGLLYSPAPVKGFDIAWPALREVQRRLPNLFIRAISALAPPPELMNNELCHFNRQPEQRRLSEIYAGCDVWLCASRSEGFHLPPHEAMACRCPVVSTRVGGPMDMIRDGINGYLVEPCDSAALADRIVRVLTLGEDAWREMSRAAYDTAAQYTWEDAAAAFEQGLEMAIEKENGLARV